MQTGKDMNMIVHAVNAIKVAAAVLDNARDISEEVFTTVLREHGCSVLGGKHNVI
jgi:hypothetical protein